MFLSGQLDSTSIQIKNSLEESIPFSFSSDQTLSQIMIYELTSGVETYRLDISPDTEIIINFDIVEMNADCCTWFETKSFEIKDYSFSYSSSTGRYTVLIN